MYFSEPPILDRARRSDPAPGLVATDGCSRPARPACLAAAANPAALVEKSEVGSKRRGYG